MTQVTVTAKYTFYQIYVFWTFFLLTSSIYILGTIIGIHFIISNEKKSVGMFLIILFAPLFFALVKYGIEEIRKKRIVSIEICDDFILMNIQGRQSEIIRIEKESVSVSFQQHFEFPDALKCILFRDSENTFILKKQLFSWNSEKMEKVYDALMKHHYTIGLELG